MFESNYSCYSRNYSSIRSVPISSAVVHWAKQRTRSIEDVKSNLTRSVFFLLKTGFFELNTLDKRENA